MIKPRPNTDQIVRSTLQKAIRRGDNVITKKAIAYLVLNNDMEWLKKRLAVITYEECWSYGSKISYEEDIEIITNHYLNIAKAVKNRNAAGLGALAFELSEGDKSVYLNNKEDKAIRIIAEAIKRPNDFWKWIRTQSSNELQKTIIERAETGHKKASWPWDKAFTQAAAYLAIKDSIPAIKMVKENSVLDFPLWIGIDKHTAEGKTAIKRAAKELGIKPNVALWLSFYFESVKSSQMEKSYWWERECDWRMSSLKMSMFEGMEVWNSLRPIVQQLLLEETHKLKNKLNDNLLNPNYFKEKQITAFNYGSH